MLLCLCACADPLAPSCRWHSTGMEVQAVLLKSGWVCSPALPPYAPTHTRPHTALFFAFTFPLYSKASGGFPLYRRAFILSDFSDCVQRVSPLTGCYPTVHCQSPALNSNSNPSSGNYSAATVRRDQTVCCCISHHSAKQDGDRPVCTRTLILTDVPCSTTGVRKCLFDFVYSTALLPCQTLQSFLFLFAVFGAVHFQDTFKDCYHFCFLFPPSWAWFLYLMLRVLFEPQHQRPRIKRIAEPGSETVCQCPDWALAEVVLLSCFICCKYIRQNCPLCPSKAFFRGEISRLFFPPPPPLGR